MLLMIKVTELVKRYGSFTAVNGISFELHKGEILGFLGPNGAGKTTTMRIITTFLPLSEGQVTVGGCDVLSDPNRVRKKIGYLPETPPLYPELRVNEYLNFVGRLKGIKNDLSKRVDEIIERCGLEEKRKALCSHLSKGYRQRVGLAQALIHKPDILILDEPTSGLDPRQIIEIRDFIRGLGDDHSIMLSTHILSEASQLCDRVQIIDKGKLIATGTQDELNELVRKQECVSFRVNDPHSALEILSKKKMNCSLNQEALVISGNFGDEGRAELIAELVKGGIRIYAMESEDLSLEQLYIELVKMGSHV